MAASPAMEKLHSMVATSAIYDGERDEKDDYTRVCHPGTREDHLRDLTTWADNAPPDTRVEWLNAIAGAGKTAMLRTFCTELEEKSGCPPVSFFVWKGDARRNTLKHFPATIAYQLCQIFQVLVPHIEKAMNAAPLLLQFAFKKQMDKLVINPLLDACDAIKRERHLIVVVDGLDELDEKGLSDFLSFIPYFLSRLSSLPISLLVSSRPDAEIVAAFQRPVLSSITRATRLGASDEDIWKFLNDKFDDINVRYPHLQIEEGGMWPSRVKRAIMVRQSSGLFIWPTVAIDYIDKVKLGLGHSKRLEHVLSSAEPKPWIASPLDNLYRAILQAHAPEDPDSVAFLRFKERLAYLCLPVGLGMFLSVPFFHEIVVDWSGTPVRVVFDETLDELWDSVAGLSSLFSPRTTLSGTGESRTPAISHRSLRDFTFNRARCGDRLYYSSERELHTEVVCKFLKFFNTRQAYKDCTEMSADFIACAGKFLESHLKEAAISEGLGRCMDDVNMEAIPTTWPLAAQILLIVKLFCGLYNLATYPDFPEGLRRREGLLSKMAVFFKGRTGTSEEWDIALLRLARVSSADFKYSIRSYHSVQCWHVARSPQCTCWDGFMRKISLYSYQAAFRRSTLFQDAKSRLVTNEKGDIAQDSIDVLHFILSLSETNPRTTQLSSFIPVSNTWICALLGYCPPNNNLYNVLGPICTAPLPALPRRKKTDSSDLVGQFLDQTEAFRRYTKRCREAGIETKFPQIKIPDDWWGDESTRNHLLRNGYKPPFDIPDAWWGGNSSRDALLEQGYTPQGDVFSDIILDTPVSDVADVQPAPLPTDPPRIGPIPDPASVPAEQAVVPITHYTPASSGEDAQQATLPTIIPPHPVTHALPIPGSASVEQTKVSGITRPVTDSGAQPADQHHRGGVRGFFKKIVHRR